MSELALLLDVNSPQSRQFLPEEYEHDFFNALKLQEEKEIPVYQHSPQLGLRSELIKWMQKACALTGLSIVTLHLSVKILDIFMDGYDIRAYRLRSVAAACLMLAAKFEEKSVPTYAKVLSVAPTEFSEMPDDGDMFIVELKVLQRCGFRLHTPTMAHSALFLIPRAVQESDLDQRRSSMQELRLDLRDQALANLETMLFERSAMMQSHSQLGCACVLVARRQLNLDPEWPQSLCSITGYSHMDLVTAINMVLNSCRVNKTDKAAASAGGDSGYSGSPVEGAPPPRVQIPSCELLSPMGCFTPQGQDTPFLSPMGCITPQDPDIPSCELLSPI